MTRKSTLEIVCRGNIPKNSIKKSSVPRAKLGRPFINACASRYFLIVYDSYGEKSSIFQTLPQASACAARASRVGRAKWCLRLPTAPIGELASPFDAVGTKANENAAHKYDMNGSPPLI